MSRACRPSASRDALLNRLAEFNANNAMRALLHALPSVHTCADGSIDFASTPDAVLASVADNAEVTAACIGLGLSAIGNIIPYAAPEMGEGTISSDSIEALGWLMAELGDVAATCFVLASLCRQQCGPNAAAPLECRRAQQPRDAVATAASRPKA